ncbi:PREDICTED: uncharacterized protein LOC109117172 [Tarenaya hassleriana]|uniref:uncharacterized protein LOC109117172 n=1 Tax=Tarenaya hassleriana TaxID=28532 RepID=UPI0008FD326E|nr:PREDICTED: uncharacterized protein LOC109117172 [Tarenaya hassleriana]
MLGHLTLEREEPTPTLVERVIMGQPSDPLLSRYRDRIKEYSPKGYRIDEKGALHLGNRLYVPDDPALRQEILAEAHQTRLAMHPGASESRATDVGREIAAVGDIVVEVRFDRYGLCSRVTTYPKEEERYLGSVDRLTKSAHFLPIRLEYPIERFAQIYIDEIVRLHGVPSEIISDRYARFTSRLWKAIQDALGTKLKMSTAYHP